MHKPTHWEVRTNKDGSMTTKRIKLWHIELQWYVLGYIVAKVADYLW